MAGARSGRGGALNRPGWPRLARWAAAVACLAVVPLLASDFYLSLATTIGIYSLVALGLVLLTGVAGLTSFGQAGFAGVAAYTTALLTSQWGWSAWTSLPVAIVFAVIAAQLLGLITLRLRGHYFPLATLAWSISLYFLFGTLPALGGFTGLTDVPPLRILGREILHPAAYFAVTWAFALAALWLTGNLLDSRPGRAIRGLKARAAMVESFGVAPSRLRILVFVYAAGLAAVSGWLYAHYQRFVNPSPFGLQMGIEYLFMAVVGGAGSVWGAVLGASLIAVIKEILQDLLPKLLGQSGQFEIVAFGVLIIALLQGSQDGAWPLLARLSQWYRPKKVRGASPDGGHVAGAAGGTSSVSGMAGETALAARGLRKTFGGLVAVDSLSFSLSRGEILAIIGPNGAGKTTLFNLLSGFLPPAAGELTVLGRPATGLPPHAMAKLGMARTFQHVQLVGDMSVLDNVAIGATGAGRSGLLRACLHLEREEEKSLRELALRQLERVGLAGRAQDPAGTLALGQQRLVEIARALCARPAVLLLDEPAAGLRAGEKRQLTQLLRALRADGLGILLVEHDMDLVMDLVDRLVVMNFGTQLAQGTPQEILGNPAVIEAYLGADESTPVPITGLRASAEPPQQSVRASAG